MSVQLSRPFTREESERALQSSPSPDSPTVWIYPRTKEIEEALSTCPCCTDSPRVKIYPRSSEKPLNVKLFDVALLSRGRNRRPIGPIAPPNPRQIVVITTPLLKNAQLPVGFSLPDEKN